jgi:hypothetical protein
VSGWREESETLSLLSQAGEFPAMVAEAASWAERITLCVSAPQSELGSLPWWRELIARSSKCTGVYVRFGERAERWLLQRLHAAGVLRLVDVVEGQPVASNLLLFERADELRAVLAHIPLERAVAGAGFGALLGFRGGARGEFARACRAQVEGWAALARIPTGREIDVMTLDVRRRKSPPALELPQPLRIVSDPNALSASLARVAGAAAEGLGTPAAPELEGASLRPFDGGYRLSAKPEGETAFALTLYPGAGWVGGNALLLDDGAGRAVLVWRGSLLGPSRSRAELVWGEARLASFLLEDPAHGFFQRVAVVAASGAPLGPQLGAFFREIERLCDVFGVQPPPWFGHLLSDFATLSPKQQALLAWRALIGSGAQGLGAATAIAADALRAQGYFLGQNVAPGSPAHHALARLLDGAADAGLGFDRPRLDQLRAIQPDPAAYVLDDWLECLVLAMPESGVVAQRSALRLAFEHARRYWGLEARRLSPDGAVERALSSAVASALCRGLLVRVGAGGLERLTSDSPSPDLPEGALIANRSEHGFIAGWQRALEGLDPVQRWLLTRSSGWYGVRAPLERAAQVLGLGPDRAAALLADAWQKVAVSSGWARAARSRLERALAGARSVPVRLLVLDDAWWRGVEDHLELAEAVFETALAGEFHRVTIEARGRQAFFARFRQAEVDRALHGLFDRAAEVDAPASIDAFAALCEAAAAELDPGLAEYLRDALEARLELDPTDRARVLSVVPAPSSAIDDAITPRGEGAEASLALEDALLAVFRTAGTPLSLTAVVGRLGERMDVDEASLAERLARAPFVQRNADQYGLLGRDVPGGQRAIASVLNDLTEVLEVIQRPLDAERAWALAHGRVQDTWSAELLRSLIGSDPVLSVSPAGATQLRRWPSASSELPGDPLWPNMPAGARLRLERRLLSGAPPEAELLGQRLAAELHRLDREEEWDDPTALPLARQLADVSQRLLQQVGALPEATRGVVLGAIAMVLEAVTLDESAPDGALIDREALREARAVLAALLRQHELDWL